MIWMIGEKPSTKTPLTAIIQLRTTTNRRATLNRTTLRKTKASKKMLFPIRAPLGAHGGLEACFLK